MFLKKAVPKKKKKSFPPLKGRPPPPPPKKKIKNWVVISSQRGLMISPNCHIYPSQNYPNSTPPDVILKHPH